MSKVFLLLFLACISLEALEPKTTMIEADKAHYDGNKVTLHGEVTIQNLMGKVTADHAILIRDLAGKSAIDFPWLELSTHVEAHMDQNRTLKCEKVTLDYVKMTSLFLGAPEVYYHDEMGELYADRALVEYVEREGKIDPIKITLSGNVKMSHLTAMQYALADEVEYFPDEERLVMKAEVGKHVLFFDKSKGLQLSAAEVRAKRIAENGKESIQGVGDVCLIFQEDELKKLKEVFSGNI